MKKLISAIFATILPITAYADNITVTQGSGKTVAFDDISSVNYQRIKLIHGADGSNSGDVATANPLPIQLRTSGGTETGTAGNPIQCSLENSGLNATAIKTDGSAVTQPVSASSLPLPAGASTSANQTTQITSLQLLDDVVKTDDTAFAPATDKVSMIGAEVDNTATDSVDEGDAGAVRMSTNRNLYFQIRDGQSGAERGAAVDSSGNLSVAINNANNSNPVHTYGLGAVKSGTGTINTAGANSYRQSLSDGTKGYDISVIQITGTWTGTIKFQVSQDSNTTYTDVPAINYATGLPVSSTTANGVFWVGTSAATDVRLLVSVTGSGTASVAINSIAGAGGLSQVAGTVVKASDDSSSYLSIDLDETEEEVKATSAVLKGYYYKNEASSTRYIKLFDLTAADTDVGTDEPKLVFPIPAGAAANVIVPDVLFSVALTAACTTGIAHTDTGAPGANECIVNFYYK